MQINIKVKIGKDLQFKIPKMKTKLKAPSASVKVVRHAVKNSVYLFTTFFKLHGYLPIFWTDGEINK